MNILQAILLGIVQGLTEFLPVSSSGHLVLFRQFLGLEGEYLFFDTMLHVGTLAAVCFVFYKDIVKLLKKPFQKLTYMLALATIPAVVFSLLFDSFFEGAFEGRYLGFGFLLTSLVLCLAEKFFDLYGEQGIYKNRESKRFPDYKEALIMGVAQACAIVPGLSRSGSTVAGGIISKVDREGAARFSFLMSIPAILGSVVLQSFSLIKDGAPEGLYVFPTVIGMIFAAVSGFFAVRYMYMLIKSKRLYGFAAYTAALGALVLLDQFVLNLVLANPLA